MSNEIIRIFSVYDSILESKKIIKEFDVVKLNTTSYSNVKYDNDATSTDSVNKALLDDIQTAAAKAGVVATITTAKSGHGELTSSNNASRHMTGAGVDIGLINGIGSSNATNATNGNPQFRELGNKLKDELVRLGYTWNKESGNPKAVLWQTNTGGNHFSHIHISNNSDTPSISGSTGGSQSSDKSTPTFGSGVDTYVANFGADTAKSMGFTESKNMTESREFGKNTSMAYGKIIIPSGSNPKIKSPVSGLVSNTRYDSSCRNQITIQTDNDDQMYYHFCNITTPRVRNGQKISAGEVLGETSNDVEVSVYDKYHNKTKFRAERFSKKSGKSDDYRYDDDTKKDKKEKNKEKNKDGKGKFLNLSDKRYDDPAIAALVNIPLGLLGLKEDIDRIKGLLK